MSQVLRLEMDQLDSNDHLWCCMGLCLHFERDIPANYTPKESQTSAKRNRGREVLVSLRRSEDYFSAALEGQS